MGGEEEEKLADASKEDLAAATKKSLQTKPRGDFRGATEDRRVKAADRRSAFLPEAVGLALCALLHFSYRPLQPSLFLLFLFSVPYYKFKDLSHQNPPPRKKHK